MLSEVQFLQQIWRQIWEDIAPQKLPPDFQQIAGAYQQSHRHYHTLQHLHECFLWWSRCRDLMQTPNEVALALFYHDVVYDPKRSDNELQSAKWMQEHLQHYLSEPQLERLYQWILATAEHQLPENAPADDLVWVLDIDLGILSADAERFQEYERQIRLEYRHVPLLIYRYKRRQVLKHFAKASPLFHTDYFRTHLEAAAKINLSAV